MTQFLTANGAYEKASFHMPGHKGRMLWSSRDFPEKTADLMRWDITEVPGADNLFQAEGIVRDLQQRYAELYGVKKSYLLINGSSCGIIAAILASVPRGGKIIMARNCHKSAFHALTLGDIQPVYAYPQMIGEYGISGGVDPEEIQRLLSENPDADAVILPSPNYYGICSDIDKIAEIVHNRGKVLIVDQAHGAHLKFFELHGSGTGLTALSAETSGADLVINSTHKTLASFTQSALLNVNSDRTDTEILEEKLQFMESTSPSYLLMASLDLNEKLLRQQRAKLIGDWADGLDTFYRNTADIPGLTVMDAGKLMDRTKINLDFSRLGISGAELEQMLLKEGIVPELVTGNIVMCMTGIGNRQEDYRLLEQVLRNISADAEKTGRSSQIADKQSDETADFTGFQPRGLYPVPQEKHRTKLEDAEGKICASSIIPYPPGIPLICPGEKITAEVIDYIRSLRKRGEKVIGVLENEQIFTD